jgi:hypothetical protein
MKSKLNEWLAPEEDNQRLSNLPECTHKHGGDNNTEQRNEGCPSSGGELFSESQSEKHESRNGF